MAAPLALDDFDHRLLDLLQRDSGVTLTTLGEAVGLSASAVQRRITRYRRLGLLGEIAVLDAIALPASSLATVWIAMGSDSRREHAALRTGMRGAREVQQCD